jgi:predicted SAM-dependent methyltransferase
MMDEHFWVNGERIETGYYGAYHDARIKRTLSTLKMIGGRRVMELGGHPWVMTANLVDSDAFDLCATVSAEEVTKWADDIGVTARTYHLRTRAEREATFTNYSANLERQLFDIKERPDTVLACEIVEHLVRAPHVMFLNINRWLRVGGQLLVSTPNGAQFSNPLRRRSPTPAFRCYIYERHEYLYTLDELVDLVSLCGFKVTVAGYWDVYRRTGPSSVYGWLGRVPLPYLRDKFQKTIFLTAQKQNDVTELPRTPRVYVPNPDWELIAPATMS